MAIVHHKLMTTGFQLELVTAIVSRVGVNPDEVIGVDADTDRKLGLGWTRQDRSHNVDMADPTRRHMRQTLRLRLLRPRKRPLGILRNPSAH